MSSAFFGLEIAVRGLRAHQRAMDVTGHNVANASTPGYSRQRAELVATPPLAPPAMNRPVEAGQVGTGVGVEAIVRARDTLLDIRVRTESALLAQAQVAADALEASEVLLNEPTSGGLDSLLGAFYNAWQDLANDPEDATGRMLVVRRATDLAAGFNRLARGFGAVAQDANDQLSRRVADVNDAATQVAALNRQIVQSEFVGQHANDLRDRRDLLLDRLAQLAQASTLEQPDGSVDVLLGGRALVRGYSVDALSTTPTGPGGVWEVRFASDTVLATLSGGVLRGLLDVRDQAIPAHLARLDQIAASIITSVNGLHVTGYGQDGMDGRPFFSGTDASTIAVDPAIVGASSLIGAASAPGEPGNNTVALAIAQLRHSQNPNVEDQYGVLVSTLGADARSARREVEGQQIAVDFLARRREAVSGVSLDEEAVNLVRYQRAYEAAARVITVVDQMLDKLINQTGVVGR